MHVPCRSSGQPNSKFISSVMPHVLCHNADGAADNALHLQSLDNNNRISRKDRADRTRGESESTGGEDMQRINLCRRPSLRGALCSCALLLFAAIMRLVVCARALRDRAGLPLQSAALRPCHTCNFFIEQAISCVDQYFLLHASVTRRW